MLDQSSLFETVVDDSIAVNGNENHQNDGEKIQLFCESALTMSSWTEKSIALTVTSPPYWNAIDYDIHAKKGQDAWHRERDYCSFGDTFDDYLDNIGKVFSNVMKVTLDGGFCAIVVGTILYNRKHIPAPMLITERMLEIGWEFHQDIIWNKVTGGVKRAGTYIQHQKAGYFYPNIMTEYILVFRKPGEMRRGSEQALEIDTLFTRDIANNIWHIAPVPPGHIDHPCPYPEELVRRLVVLYSDPREYVLDPFLGSGQTALVAYKEDRYFVGFDIEQTYIDLTKERIVNPPPPRAKNLIPKYEKLAIQSD